MKTFDEAMMLGRFEREDVKAQAVADERVERYRSLADEVANSPLTLEMLMAVLIGIPERMTEKAQDVTIHECMMSILMSTFLNGVMIGIEMEKPE